MNKDYGNLENCLLKQKETYDSLLISEGLFEESGSLCCISMEDNVRRDELQLQGKVEVRVKK